MAHHNHGHGHNHNQEQMIKEMMIKENLKKIKNRLVVLSGKGGVGKSTVTVNLAYALTMNGFKVGIIDVDIHGPSIGRLTGIEGRRLTYNDKKRAQPIEVISNLYVMTLASLMESADDPIVWRGPAKMGVIREFLADVEWPELDYLIIDCPPGTGDEPLSVIQLIGEVDGTIIVSTPQDVAFLDARKTINFSKLLKTPVLGLVENMAGFVCPCCNEKVDIFKSGGAEKAAKDFGLDILGKIPLDTNIVNSGDEGKAYVYNFNKTAGAKEFMSIAKKVMDKVEQLKKEKAEAKTVKQSGDIKVAIPLEDGKLSPHFGQTKEFVIYSLKDNKVRNRSSETAPEAGHSALPAWLKEQGVGLLVTGGIGNKAVDLLKEQGIEVVCTNTLTAPLEIIQAYVEGQLKDEGNGGCGCGGNCH